MLLSLFALILELAWLASFFYGAYCAIQTWGHRLPPRHRHHNLFPIDEQLDPAGRVFLRRAAKAWGIAIGLMLLGAVVF